MSASRFDIYKTLKSFCATRVERLQYNVAHSSHALLNAADEIVWDFLQNVNTSTATRNLFKLAGAGDNMPAKGAEEAALYDIISELSGGALGGMYSRESETLDPQLPCEETEDLSDWGELQRQFSCIN
eukprot:GILI01025022.1.p1 GENE.GILI01025022.1~~GILI01025022.1.p1  ORF type:complete len:128 (-),score=16.39 GILI01025022.1:182-565(-)